MPFSNLLNHSDQSKTHIPATQQQQLKHTQTCSKQKHWIVVQLYKLIWIWCVSLPEALDVCTYACVCARVCVRVHVRVCVALLRRSNAVWLGPVLSAEQRHGRSTSASLHKRWGGQGCSSSSPTVWHLKVQSAILGAHQLCVHTRTAPMLKTPLGSLHSIQVAKCWIFREWSKVMQGKCVRAKTRGWTEGKKKKQQLIFQLYPFIITVTISSHHVYF